ncbi:DLA class II histocompatibility antigen, DR-1 beta chain-like [Pelodiscus sinensis]|uniref:DLA class II histocompatibility antigen, DR-1 beta chain-like n=1 Tax=Pelodiscus sinensis TaxID=13735 RepID=UPI003F6C44FE
MASWVKPTWVSFCLLSLCSDVWAGLHRLSFLQLITPQAAPGLPKRLNVLKVDDLLLSVYDSDSGRVVPRNGYNQDRQDFWRPIRAECLSWDSWVETTYQALVREVNASAPRAEPYYMQILQTCELDDATGDIRAITKYSLNGEDVLQHQSDQNLWFSVHPAAWSLAERWNRARETFAEITPQRCMFIIEESGLFITGKTAQPTAHLTLVPGTQARPHHLVCHVTGFYPRPIEVTWERGGQVAQGEQLTSGILPNGDLTFQIQVSIELDEEGGNPTEHVCVVRHSSLGNTPLRVTWDSQSPGLPGVLWIVIGCVLAALSIGTLGLFLWKRPGAWKRLYRPART